MMGPREELKEKVQRRTDSVVDATANGTAAVGLHDPNHDIAAYESLDIVKRVEQACPDEIEMRVYVTARPGGVGVS
ncbi:hypothetical protein SY89_03109 [Halolamina pelagica]|uniref:Uncharacterized protein n=1 Tax=Halolamina pelagica TaxID=699431 RepID=A0A0P7GTN8_9EURY|nr:hypothetical protein [Halolamina pelagica]KPN29297.1 hypothetical protein SY89_00010 [Halolamina pelagica]KPN32341.1 hypothetical protein SY89_03109 [Halolamina pelagica]